MGSAQRHPSCRTHLARVSYHAEKRPLSGATGGRTWPVRRQAGRHGGALQCRGQHRPSRDERHVSTTASIPIQPRCPSPGPGCPRDRSRHPNRHSSRHPARATDRRLPPIRRTGASSLAASWPAPRPQCPATPGSAGVAPLASLLRRRPRPGPAHGSLQPRGWAACASARSRRRPACRPSFHARAQLQNVAPPIRRGRPYGLSGTGRFAQPVPFPEQD